MGLSTQLYAEASALDARDLGAEVARRWADVDVDQLGRAFAILVIGVLVARLLAWMVVGLTRVRSASTPAILIRRGIFYPLALVSVLAALRELGFDLGIFLGAAGVLTVGLGIASQTSASNIISGLFLLGERAFSVGDVIRVETMVGRVVSVDLLSIKIRTFDNLMVRIPNETLVRSPITNLTRYPIRRIDLMIRVRYGESLAAVREALFETAARSNLILEEPKPTFWVEDFEERAIKIQFSVWTRTENYTENRAALQEAIVDVFIAQQIEPPADRQILQGPGGGPVSIRVVDGALGVAGGSRDSEGSHDPS